VLGPDAVPEARARADIAIILVPNASWLRSATNWPAKPKLRLIGRVISVLAWGFPVRAGWCSGYVEVSGIGVPIRSKACRWVLVGSVSIGTSAGAPANRTWLRVRVARWASRPRKLR